jgi:hypothetical protein
MSLSEAASPSGLTVRQAARAAFLVGALLCPLAAGAQGVPADPQPPTPAPAPAPASPPSAAGKTAPGTPDAASAPAAPTATTGAPRPAATDASRARDTGVRTTTRARQRLRECRAEASKRPHLWGLARVKFIKRCRRMPARP